MTTLTYVANPALYREIGIEAQAGDQVKLYLDTGRVPAFPESIVGVIQNPVTRVCGGTSYPVEYDEDDLTGSGVTELVDADIVSVTVTSEAGVLFENCVRFDATQTKTATEKYQACANAGAIFNKPQRLLSIQVGGGGGMGEWTFQGLTNERPQYQLSYALNTWVKWSSSNSRWEYTAGEEDTLQWHSAQDVSDPTRVTAWTADAGVGTVGFISADYISVSSAMLVLGIQNFDNDTAAATGGVAVGGVYYCNNTNSLRARTV